MCFTRIAKRPGCPTPQPPCPREPHWGGRGPAPRRGPEGKHHPAGPPPPLYVPHPHPWPAEATWHTRQHTVGCGCPACVVAAQLLSPPLAPLGTDGGEQRVVPLSGGGDPHLSDDVLLKHSPRARKMPIFTGFRTEPVEPASAGYAIQRGAQHRIHWKRLVMGECINFGYIVIQQNFSEFEASSFFQIVKAFESF